MTNTKKQQPSKSDTEQQQPNVDVPQPFQAEPPTPAVDRPGPVDDPAQPAQPAKHGTAD